MRTGHGGGSPAPQIFLAKQYFDIANQVVVRTHGVAPPEAQGNLSRLTDEELEQFERRADAAHRGGPPVRRAPGGIDLPRDWIWELSIDDNGHPIPRPPQFYCLLAGIPLPVFCSLHRYMGRRACHS